MPNYWGGRSLDVSLNRREAYDKVFKGRWISTSHKQLQLKPCFAISLCQVPALTVSQERKFQDQKIYSVGKKARVYSSSILLQARLTKTAQIDKLSNAI